MVAVTGYNLSAEFLALGLKEETKTKKAQLAKGQIVTDWNNEIKMLSELDGLLAKESASSQAVLYPQRNLIDRIRLKFKEVLLDAGTYVWNGSEMIRSQRERIKAKIEEIQQNMSLKYAEMGQELKEASEKTQIAADTIRKQADHMAKMLQLR